MRGWSLIQEGHLVNALPPVDINGGASTDRFHMKLHRAASFIVQIGVSASAPTSIIAYAATAATAGTSTAIPFRYAAETTAAGDTLGAMTEVAATGITSVTANDNVMYVIEIDANQLPDGSPWVYITLANASGNSVIASVAAVLSGSRFGHDENETVIA